MNDTIVSAISVLNSLNSPEIKGKRTKILEILKQNKSNEVLKSIFLYTYDTFTTYGITDAKTIKQEKLDYTTAWNNFCLLLKKLSNRQLTGNVAISETNKTISQAPDDLAIWLKRIINRDLQLNIAEATVLTVWPNLIETFCLAKADVYNSSTSLNYPVWVEPKLDGMRIALIIKNKKGTAKSYNGKDYTPVFQHMIDAILKVNDTDAVYDGEALAKNWNDTMTLVRTTKEKDLERVKKELFFHVFDKTTLSIFTEEVDNTPLELRHLSLKKTIDKLDDDVNIRIIPRYQINNDEELLDLYDHFISLGYEGIMIKLTNSKYLNKRSNVWLKYKPSVTLEGIIVKCEEGVGKYKEMLGSFSILLENGSLCSCGTGLSDDQRTEFWENKDSLIGKFVEIIAQKQEETNKVATVRFPVFKRIRTDLEPVYCENINQQTIESICNLLKQKKIDLKQIRNVYDLPKN